MQQEGSITEGWGDTFSWTSTSSVEQGDSPTQDVRLKLRPKRKRQPAKIKRTPKSTVGSSGPEWCQKEASRLTILSVAHSPELTSDLPLLTSPPAIPPKRGGGISQLDQSPSHCSPSILDLQPHKHPVNTPVTNPQQDHDPVVSTQVPMTSGQTDVLSTPDTICNILSNASKNSRPLPSVNTECNTPSNAIENASPIPSVNIQPIDNAETGHAKNQLFFSRIEHS